MRVTGKALGANGATLYRTDAGDFFLYPLRNSGWLCFWKSGGMTKNCASRAEAVEAIQTITLA